MAERIHDHIRSNVIGYLALFCFAMGGTAHALDGSNTVFTDDIVNGEVKSGDIGDLEVKASDIAADSLGSGKIANLSVKNIDLATGASSSNTIADGGIQGIDVKNNTLTGTQIAEATLFNDNSLTGADIDESTLTGLPSASGWNLAGNSGTTGADFLGTTDNQPLELRVNNARAMRLEPASDGTTPSPNVIGGSADNSVSAGVYSATVAGGGRVAGFPGTGNEVTDHQGTVGGGANNQAGDGAGTPGDRTLATVGGGGSNTASGEAATVAGGQNNTASGSRATVGGGDSNNAGGDRATVAGGAGNTAGGERATVAGGSGNSAGGVRATVGGGDGNTASGSRATVAGGLGNGATGENAAVGGGFANSAGGFRSVVAGGEFNSAAGDYSFAGGRFTQANQNGTFVWADSKPFFFSSTAQDQFSVRSTGGARFVTGLSGGGAITSGLELPAGTSDLVALGTGQPFDVRVNNSRAFRIDPATDGVDQSPNMIGGTADNSVSAGVHSATIAGGGRGEPANPASANQVTDNYGTVAGGASNQAGDAAGGTDDRIAATVAGGFDNEAGGDRATVGGGDGNVSSGPLATIGGGFNNEASGERATIPGGSDNIAQGDFSFAGGLLAQANDQGTFVWGDSNPFPFPSTDKDQFSVRATGGARFVSAIDPVTGDPTAGVELASGAGSWSSLSDAAAKRRVEPVSGRAVLSALASVPVSTWSYRSQDDSIRHIGPMAQDFFRAFGVGEDRRHISSVDADGVALAAIKGLDRKLRAERSRRHELERHLARIEARLAALERGR